MKTIVLLFICSLTVELAYANLKYHPVSFLISTDKESYFEGEKITFIITITNTSQENTYPVLLPHTQNTGQKLIYLTAYDKANNTLLKRYTEDKMLNMLVHDTGTVKIKYLKPQEQIVIQIYLNDFENYYSYHTQTASHHSFGVPLFAGIYKINLTYNPYGILLADSIYTYYDDFDKNTEFEGKQAMPTNGQITQMIDLKIKRSADTIVSIERNNYYIKTDKDRFFYLSENLPQITTDIRCHHITNLPPDSCSLKNEYFYSHFTDLYAEYVNRFEDGEIREYRKYSDYCPEYLYTEKYNEFKQKTLYQVQLYNKTFYSIDYHQPGGKAHQESYCSADGTLCNVTTYIYNEKGELLRKNITQTEPCITVEEKDGKKRSYKRGILEVH
jgi:hypothetical protein